MSNEFIEEKMSMAELLLSSRRYDEAHSLLTDVIAHDPDYGDAHYQMAITYWQMEGKKRQALESANKAIQCDAEEPYYYTLKAQLLANLNKVREAHDSADAALRLDPDISTCYVAKGQCYIHQEKWANAEQQLRKALELDADNEIAGNYLAHCLRMQNRMPDTDETVEQLLSENPEDPLTHFNAGWAALQNGDNSKAEEHFTEALRLDPEFDNARQGLIECFKSRSAFYRAYLKYNFFMQQFTAKARWFIIIGLIVGVNVGRRLLEQIHPLIGTALVIAYLLFVLWIWLADGVGNFLIMLDSRARLALKKSQKLGAIAVGGGFFLALALIFGGIASGITTLAFAGGFLGLSTLPASLTFTNKSKKGRLVFGSMTAVFYLGFILCLAGLTNESISTTGKTLFWLSIWLAVACTWIGGIPSLHRKND